MNKASAVVWNCQWQQLPASITVGTPLQLDCGGPSVSFNAQMLHFEFAENTPYLLVIRNGSQMTDTMARLQVVSYMPGEHHPKDFMLTDGEHSALVSNLDWTVASVIKKETNQNPEPFGPYGPFHISVPWYVWLLMGATILLIAGLISLRVRKYLQRRNWVKQIRSQLNPLGAYHHFSKIMRGLARQYNWEKGASTELQNSREFVTQLNEAFRVYLAQELLVPAQIWGSKSVLHDLKRRERQVFRQTGERLSLCLKELDRAIQSGKILAAVDCQQLFDLVRSCAEAVWKSKQESVHARRML